MFLEETVTFYEEEEAAEFIAFLRKQGCPCQRLVRGSIFREEVITGTLDQLITWYGKEIARYEETGSSEKEIAWFQAGQEKFRQSREHIRGLIAGRTPGDILYTSQDVEAAMHAVFPPKATNVPSGSCESTVNGEPVDSAVLPGSSGKQDSPLKNPLFMVHWMLRENGVVTETPEGYALARETDPGGISLEMCLDHMPDIDLMNAPGMAPTLQIGLDPMYVIIADPLIHFVCDPEEVIELLRRMEMADEVFETVAENLFGKQLIVQAIIEEVGQAPGISVADLAERIRKRAAGDHLPMVEFFIELPILTSVVTEMRKRDILAGNDQKVRVAAKNQGRRK